MPVARQPGESPRTRNRKGPTDQTGREDERLRSENQAAIDAAAQQMSLVAETERQVRSKVVDYTDAARPKPEPTPTFVEPQDDKPYKVRVVADIENMTFGKEIVDHGDFTDPMNPRMPVLGGLKRYDFQEGVEYLVDKPMYEHLKQLGYLYDF